MRRTAGNQRFRDAVSYPKTFFCYQAFPSQSGSVRTQAVGGQIINQNVWKQSSSD
jgi:hypothetical protein